ncbi:Uncharacterised protein [Bordetella pertussis]|nr:Uncharacterised protein [Bordetella pertussis]
MTEAVTSSKVRADCEPSSCTSLMRRGLSVTSCSVAWCPAPGLSPISPIEASSCSARPVLTGSLGTAMVAPCGMASPFFSFFENRPMVVE